MGRFGRPAMAVTTDMLKPIPGYPHYMACVDGRIFSLYTMSWLSATQSSTGYMQVCLCENGEKMQRHVHRLVAETFIPCEDDSLVVNHIDENKTNNHVSNLEWCTTAENLAYGTAKQRAVETVGIERLRELADSARKCRKFKPVRNVDTGQLFATTGEAARFYGLRNSGIHAACNGRSKTCGGYRWKYEVA